jgi:hypothetical protein
MQQRLEILDLATRGYPRGDTDAALERADPNSSQGARPSAIASCWFLKVRTLCSAIFFTCTQSARW